NPAPTSATTITRRSRIRPDSATTDKVTVTTSKATVLAPATPEGKPAARTPAPTPAMVMTARENSHAWISRLVVGADSSRAGGPARPPRPPPPGVPVTTTSGPRYRTLTAPHAAAHAAYNNDSTRRRTARQGRYPPSSGRSSADRQPPDAGRSRRPRE